MTDVEAAIARLVTASGAGHVAVVAALVGDPSPATGVSGASGGDVVEIDGDRAFHAASTMKVPVLVELERRAAAGDLAMDDMLVVRNAFRSIADGSPYRLRPADDSEIALYAREGEAVTLRELATLAITVSSNLATNLLVNLLGAEAITATMAAMGAPSLVVRRGVEDDAAWRAGLNNEVTARGLATVMGAIARREAVSPEASDDMLAILRAQAFDEGIPAGLPTGAVVAHKTGSIAGLYHDAGIVHPPAAPPFALVVLTTGLDEADAAPRLVAAIARLVHDAIAGGDTPAR